MKTVFRFIFVALPPSALAVAALFCFGTNAFAAQKKSIVCETFPAYDWTMNILGGRAANFGVTLLQDNGTDLHSYQPSIKDVVKISSCDLLIYVGGESDEWIEKAADGAKNKNMLRVGMLDSLGSRVKEEEAVEGMQAEEEDEYEIEYDEHVWLSLKNSALLVDAIRQKIEALDPAGKDVYASNAASYKKRLAALDAEFEKAVSSAKKKTLLFGDRFPFRYFTDDYNLSYYAAFAGCSAESEASFETVIFLAKKVDELGLSAILTIEKSDKKIARTIAVNTKAKNQEILEMDSLQSAAQAEIKAGKSYLGAMEKNLQTLKKALR